MSIFEWLFERRNPGPVGTLETEAPAPGHWHPLVIVVRAICAVGVLVAAEWAISRFARDSHDAAIATVVLILYCVIGYNVTAKPHLDNMGWAGGFVDNPFRYSDDVNRSLLLIGVLLWPGRFISVSLRDVVLLWSGKRTMILPPRR